MKRHACASRHDNVIDILCEARRTWTLNGGVNWRSCFSGTPNSAGAVMMLRLSSCGVAELASGGARPAATSRRELGETLAQLPPVRRGPREAFGAVRHVLVLQLFNACRRSECGGEECGALACGWGGCEAGKWTCTPWRLTQRMRDMVRAL